MPGAWRVRLMASVPFMASVWFVIAYCSVAACVVVMMRD